MSGFGETKQQTRGFGRPGTLLLKVLQDQHSSATPQCIGLVIMFCFIALPELAAVPSPGRGSPPPPQRRGVGPGPAL